MLQRNLDQLADWAKKWQLRVYIEKCKTMHHGGIYQRGTSKLQHGETRWKASDIARNNRRETSRSVGELHCKTDNPRGPRSHENESIAEIDFSKDSITSHDATQLNKTVLLS